MLLRKIKHSLYIILMKTFAGLAPAARHCAFAGAGSSRQLGLHIARSGARRVLVVTDKPLRELGVVDKAVAGLQAANIELAYFDGVLPDPTYDQVAAGVDALRAHAADAVLAVGGGSSIDAAKIIAASANSDEDPQSWVGFGKVKHEVVPLYAVPTTSGTGSEATMGAVISNAQTHEKGVISGASLLPKACALDPELIAGLPSPITAATGMDALTHAIEAYISIWDRGSRAEDAKMSVRLVFKYLAAACRDGSDSEAREGMAMAAYYGGLAINQVNVGNVHAIAHQLGGKYGIPHGLANALVLPHVLDFCRTESESRLADLGREIGLGQAGDGDARLCQLFMQAVKDLRAEVGIADTSELVKREDFGAIAALAIAEGDGYPTPKLLSEQDVFNILGKIAA